MYDMGFYDRFISSMGNLRDKPDMATPYKIGYLKQLIQEDKVYKFISFQENADAKLKTLIEGKVWFSFYKILNDKTEFKIYYDMEEVVKKTGYSQSHIKSICNYLTEMYDVFSLTYAYEDYMWNAYASGGNGICVEYNVGDYDFLYPVEYREKDKINYTQMLISALNENDLALSVIPWVIKNPYNFNAGIDSSLEKEVRMLYCPYDLAEFNNGLLKENIKESLGYKGIAKSLSAFKLSISKIILGNQCDVSIKDKIVSYANENDIPVCANC